MTVVKMKTKPAMPEQVVAPDGVGNGISLSPPMKALEANLPPAKPRIVMALVSALRTLFPPLLGFAVFVALWAIIAQQSGIPNPSKTWESAVQLFSDPFSTGGRT